jgi:hypothetical protein
MKILLVVGLSIFTWIAAYSGSEAKYITIETQATANIEDDHARIRVAVVNKGDEPAYNIKISTDISGQVKATPLKEILKPNEPYEEELTTTIEFKKTGRYPVIVMVDYTDQNQYPFTALSVVYLNYRESVVSRMVGQVEAAPLADRGKVKIKVKNLEQAEEKVEIRLVVPKELSSPKPKQEVTVKPGVEETIVFDITNISALPGSSYQIYAILGYEHEQYYYANAVGGNIKVEEKKTALESYKGLLIVVAIALVLIVAYFNIRRRPR